MVERTIVLIDGQNLFHLAKMAWGGSDSDSAHPYSYPSYDIQKLAAALVAGAPDRVLHQIRFYTGVPNPSLGARERRWHGFWTNKLRANNDG